MAASLSTERLPQQVALDPRHPNERSNLFFLASSWDSLLQQNPISKPIRHFD